MNEPDIDDVSQRGTPSNPLPDPSELVTPEGQTVQELMGGERKIPAERYADRPGADHDDLDRPPDVLRILSMKIHPRHPSLIITRETSHIDVGGEDIGDRGRIRVEFYAVTERDLPVKIEGSSILITGPGVWDWNLNSWILECLRIAETEAMAMIDGTWAADLESVTIDSQEFKEPGSVETLGDG